MAEVLVVLHSSGWVEVFGSDDVRAKIVVMPHMETPTGEIAAEQYLERTLPIKYRKIYFPGNRIAADMVRKVLPSDVLDALFEIDTLKMLGASHVVGSTHGRSAVEGIGCGGGDQ